eukprot:253206-Ditylum_brightwellii.AAC.1
MLAVVVRGCSAEESVAEDRGVEAPAAGMGRGGKEEVDVLDPQRKLGDGAEGIEEAANKEDNNLNNNDKEVNPARQPDIDAEGDHCRHQIEQREKEELRILGLTISDVSNVESRNAIRESWPTLLAREDGVSFTLRFWVVVRTLEDIAIVQSENSVYSDIQMVHVSQDDEFAPPGQRLNWVREHLDEFDYFLKVDDS